jgi:glucokinase
VVSTLLGEVQKSLAEIQPALPLGLALGIPGLVERSSGKVLQSPHFPKWKDLSLKAVIQSSLPFPVCIDNDANQAALGEAWLGAGCDGADFVMVTLGTGIGGGIIHQGHLFHGPNGFAGEIGHLVIDRNHLPGALGSEGTLESLASQSGLALQLENLRNEGRLQDEALRRLDSRSRDLPRLLAQLAQEGNPAAKELWENFGRALGCGLASLVHTLGIFRFVIGGGLLGAWDFFSDACRDETLRRIYSSTRDRLEIAPALLGNDAGLIGGVRAVRLFLDEKV